jgi:hypothetical protein
MLKNRFAMLSTNNFDMPFIFAAYRNGDLKIIGPQFESSTEYTLIEFTKVFLDHLTKNNLFCTTFFNVRDKVKPVGISLVWKRTRVVQVENLIWFHWASAREILGAAEHFYNTWRTLEYQGTGTFYKVLEFAQKKDEKFFDILVKKGVLEKVGEIDGIYINDIPCVFYVTKDVA